MSRGGDGREQRAARIAFLREHPELWESGKRTIVRALKEAGLLAKSTYAGDVRVDKMMLEAKFGFVNKRRGPRPSAP